MWWAMKRNSLSSNLPPQVTSLSRFILSNLNRGTATYITAAWAVSVLEMTRQLQAPKQSAQQPPIASMSCFTAWGGNNRPARSAFKVLFHLISLLHKMTCCSHFLCWIRDNFFLPFCHRVDQGPDVQHTQAERNAFGLDTKNLRPWHHLSTLFVTLHYTTFSNSWSCQYRQTPSHCDCKIIAVFPSFQSRDRLEGGETNIQVLYGLKDIQCCL